MKIVWNMSNNLFWCVNLRNYLLFIIYYRLVGIFWLLKYDWFYELLKRKLYSVYLVFEYVFFL